jgi:hypothetical protein
MVVAKTVGYVYAIEAAFPLIAGAIDPSTSFAASVGLKALGRDCFTLHESDPANELRFHICCVPPLPTLLVGFPSRPALAPLRR